MSGHGFTKFTHATKEVVLAAHFNKYGTRLVTGSADHRLRVFDLNDQGDWELIDTWRGHNSEVIDVKWNGEGEVLASIGEDLKLKIWEEHTGEPKQSGRRWKVAFSQSSPYAVVYVSLDFVNIRHDSYLAVITRDGFLSLHEPVDPTKFDDWTQVDGFWVCGAQLTRGVDTSFKVAFQHAEFPNYDSLAAGLEPTALSLAVAAMDHVKIFRIVNSNGNGPYRFQAPAAELVGARGLIRDVAWSSDNYSANDCVATAASDGYIRIYEMWTPKEALGVSSYRSSSPTMTRTRSNGHEGSRANGRGGPSGIGAGLAGVSRSLQEEDSDMGQIQHDWKIVAEIKSEGVWKVEWTGGAGMLVSTGDTGKAHLWKQGLNGKWLEFADFGPDT